jgi:hypothetical protein
VLSEADKIVDTWTANPDFKLGTVTLDSFTTERNGLVSADAAVETMRTELAALINTRDAKQVSVGELASRARAGFRAYYGPDSTQYEQAGGKRKSERSSGLHRTPKPEPAK